MKKITVNIGDVTANIHYTHLVLTKEIKHEI